VIGDQLHGPQNAFELVNKYDVGFLLLLLVHYYKVLKLSVHDEKVQMQGSKFENEDLSQTLKTSVEVVVPCGT
jgi:hypothetical protein